jgi:hypothetical protein
MNFADGTQFMLWIHWDRDPAQFSIGFQNPQELPQIHWSFTVVHLEPPSSIDLQFSLDRSAFFELKQKAAISRTSRFLVVKSSKTVLTPTKVGKHEIVQQKVFRQKAVVFFYLALPLRPLLFAIMLNTTGVLDLDCRIRRHGTNRST